MDSWVASEISIITENLIFDVTDYMVDLTMMQILNCFSAFFLDLLTNKCDTVSKSSWLCFQVPIKKIRNLVGKEGITFQNMVRAYKIIYIYIQILITIILLLCTSFLPITQPNNKHPGHLNSHLAGRYINSTRGTSTMLSREQRENSFVLQPVHCISRISSGVQCPVKYSA